MPESIDVSARDDRRASVMVRQSEEPSILGVNTITIAFGPASTLVMICQLHSDHREIERSESIQKTTCVQRNVNLHALSLH